MNNKLYKNSNNWVIESELNQTLTKKISNILNQNLDNFLNTKKNFSIVGENAEQYWLINKNNNFYFKNEYFEEIKIQYKNEILNILRNENILNAKIKNLTILPDNCWTIISQKNSYHAPHCHEGNCLIQGISTVLYLKVPKSNRQETLENNLFLIMNANPNINSFSNNLKIVNINPKVGKLLIFPTWIIHGTHPQGVGVRQTFNMEFVIGQEFINRSLNINYS
jgi:hypothetical protein